MHISSTCVYYYPKVCFSVSNIGLCMLKLVKYLCGNGHMKDKKNFFIVAVLNILDKRNNPY